MDISIVVPAYNEEKTIKDTLIYINNYCKNTFKKYEIIVVDDASTDKTYQIASKLKINNLNILKNQLNRGKGYSVKRGILEAEYGLVLFTDCDFSIPIKQLNKFIGFINRDYQIVIASKYMKGSKPLGKNYPHRNFIGRIFSLLVKILILNDFKDTQCGFKLFKTEIAKKIVRLQRCKRFAFDVELLLIAKGMGIKIKEFPIIWTPREEDTKVDIIKTSIEMLLDLIRIKINDLKGKYTLK